MRVRNLVIFDFRSYLHQNRDVTVSRTNTCNTSFCRSLHILEVAVRPLCRISYHLSGKRLRVRTSIDFHDFQNLKKSLKNQSLQIPAFCSKNIEDICYISRTFCQFLDNFHLFPEFGFENANKIFCRKTAILEAEFLGFGNCDLHANAHSCRKLPCLPLCQLASKSQF